MLLHPRNQYCIHCGEGLIISEDGRKVVTPYAQINTKVYQIEETDGVKAGSKKELKK